MSLNFTQLLGKSLKDDDMLELLEFYDIEVIYDFDRTHEGIEDFYWAACRNAGFQFRFNKDQQLDVAFLYITPREGFEPIDPTMLDVEAFPTFNAAQQAATARSIPHKTSSGAPGSAESKWWIKLDHGAYTAHYQYKNERLVMLTLAVKAGD